MQDIVIGKYMISTTIKNRANGNTFSFTGVYGPQTDPDKRQFLLELQTLRPTLLSEWIVTGDFNLIYRAEHKNNNRLHFRLMNSFKSALDSLELRELHLHGRRFTWSSGTDDPTFTKIDHLFCTEQWELQHPNCYLQALSSSMSDHCPLLLSYMPASNLKKGFRFESFCTRLPNFLEVVQKSWERPIQTRDCLRALHIKLSRLAKALKSWSKQHVMQAKLQADVTTEVVRCLDQAQEHRQLAVPELTLRKKAKARTLGFMAIRRIKIRQRSCLTWIRLGDANTKIFHLREASQEFYCFPPHKWKNGHKSRRKS
jgi:hypothetical protein